MRLYLSSYRLGDNAGALLALMGSGGRAAIISNALDYLPAAARESYRGTIHDPIKEFACLGIAADDLDLRHYFDAPSRLAEVLRAVDLVWVMGGNSFILRRAMAYSRFDRIVGDLLARDTLVYGGFSAGAVVAGPSLAGVELMDPTDVVPAGYADPVIWPGLGLVDYAVVPHYRSASPEAPAAARLAAFHRQNGTPFRALSDGEVIVHIRKEQDVEGLVS